MTLTLTLTLTQFLTLHSLKFTKLQWDSKSKCVKFGYEVILISNFYTHTLC